MKAEKNFCKKYLAFILLFLCVQFPSPAQSFFRMNWEKSYDINLSDKIHSILKSADGNFFLAGETSSASMPGQKILIIKLTPNGDLIWQKTFGGSADCSYKAIARSGTDGFYILGIKHKGSSNPLIWVVKADKDGNPVWENTTGGGGIEQIADLYETGENGVFLCGSKVIKGNNDTDGWLIKFGKKGVVEAQTMHGSKYINDEFHSITGDGSGGFFVAGNTSEKIGSEKIPNLMHLDFRGNKIWEKSYPDMAGAVPSSVYLNSDGLVVCLMNNHSSSGDLEGITKMIVDPFGIFVNSYSTDHQLNIAKNSYAINDRDQLILISAQNDDPTIFSDKYAIKMDASFKPLWVKPLEMENASIKSVHPIDNSNYLSVGWTGRSTYKLDIAAFSFRDYSEKLIESFITQNLVANAGMNVNESMKDFKLRIGSSKFDNYLSQYASEAVTSLRLIPESYSSASIERSDSQPTVISQQQTNADPSFTGKYYALLIAVEDYNDPMINDLDKPVKDAQKLLDVLINEYLFEKANVTFLKNPNREQIISTLDRLEKELSKSDNLLIFYAGHGYWNETTQKGFWLPSDASKQNTSNWIGNSSISDYVRSIPAKHTLLIADACFSGSIFKTRAAFGNQELSAMKLYELTSRKAMTSGTLTEVPDKSVFIEFLVKRLYENQDTYLPSEQLFFSFKPAVINNTESIPQYGVVGNAGDEGGDFIFVRRKK